MLDILGSDTAMIVVVIAAAIYLAARLFFSFRWTMRKGKGKGRKLDDAEATAFLADTRILVTGLEESVAKARAMADASAGTPDQPLDMPALEFDIPRRYQGDTRRLEKAPAPFGPLAALAARKAQGMRHRLFDPNWEPNQRKEGLTTAQMYDRLARDLELVASQARRVERLLREETPSPTRRLKAVKR